MEATPHVIGAVILIASLVVFALIIPLKRHTRLLSDTTDAVLMMVLVLLFWVGIAMVIAGWPPGMPMTSVR